MSKWKDKTVAIKQIIPRFVTGYNASYSTIQGIVGLGTDDKLYAWDEKAGKWEKAWDTSNE